MLWLYGVAWHQPMADTVTMAGTSIIESLPSPRSLLPQGIDGNVAPASWAASRGRRAGARRASPAARPGGAAGAPVDPDVATLFAERKRADRGAQGPRDRGCCAPATFGGPPSCAARGPISISAMPTRGAVSARREQAQGNHQDAVNAFRKAKQYDPSDRTLDAAIERSQKGIVADFLNRYRK